MQDLLFLVHRIPFPPNKGDKVRSFNLLRYLSQHYRIWLGAFVDDPDDWRHLDAVRRFCAEVHCVALDPRWAKLCSLRGLATGEPLTLPYYRHAGLQSWVDRVVAEQKIERALLFSSAMAQYLRGPRYPRVRRVMDFVDVDSAKWAQYADGKPWPLSWVYRREGRVLLAYERTVAMEFAASVFVTDQEAALFRRLAPEVLPARVTAIANGVDMDYFNPDRDYPNPYPADEQVLVFTGAMDYWANVDAVGWFARSVFPEILRIVPDSRFYIVGARPTAEVQHLAALPGVRVTGTVPDVRPWLAHAHLAVAPLRIARGVQNKVLEAMAMAQPILATPAAMEGIVPCPELPESVTNDPATLTQRVLALLADPAQREQRGRAGRNWVLRHYHWDHNLSRILPLLEGDAP
ncbi:TIGR03087 family PEP-CTERM/XrtA system glycosyltransferase [Candidatus Contendibacter odensensis]|uniref:Glycosyltransferase group 1 protein n=1 Tax=Candidatus Contendobacter odensis Run_B_J11 TaxID=1400861 RepID=A0A7U7J5H7_9GAMM|nr:TIGR03087 family PEP-CTERM/XrtA system glycosyltransferase [Candidatus Contendobacter odensis]CDH46807.1 Glycosyltransferase group 1 protein [Candidatus Contendobacter odensis Run_B_J11]